MQKRLLLTLIAAIGTISAWAAAPATAIDAFTSAPDSVMGVLSRNTRLDMIDYYTSKVDRPSANNFGGTSQVISADNQSVRVHLSGSVDAQIALIATKSDTIVVYIETVSTPVPDSDVRFFRGADWTELPADSIMPLDPDQWLSPAASQACRQDMAMELPVMLATADYDPATATLTLTSRLSDYFTPGDQPSWMAMVLPELKFKWNGRQFKRLTK